MGTSRYMMENADKKATGSRLLYISHSKYENDWPSLPHTHPFSELFFVKSGQGSLRVEHEEHPIQKDDFVIINANVSHTETSSAGKPLEYVILGVKDLTFSFKDEKEYTIFNCGNEQQNLMFYMTTMLRELEEKDKDYGSVCQNLLDVLIIKLMRQTNFSFNTASPAELSGECLKLKRYIESSYMHDLTLDVLADYSHLNKYYMVHIFTKHCGCSPIQYLCQIRIQASKELLVNTNYSIAEVAQSSGFSSQSYFAQCFQKNCGMTASAYRKSHKEKIISRAAADIH